MGGGIGWSWQQKRHQNGEGFLRELVFFCGNRGGYTCGWGTFFIVREMRLRF